MTYIAKADYYPVQALAPIQFGPCNGRNLNDAVAILMDDIREFMRREESTNWWDDIVLSVEHDHIVTNYPFEYWAKQFAWSY